MKQWDYVLDNVSIFDMNLDEEIKEAVDASGDSFDVKGTYDLTLSYNVYSLGDPVLEVIDLPVESSRRSNNTIKEKMYNLLSFQLDKADKLLTDSFELNIVNARVQGEELEGNQIKLQIVQIQEDQPKKKRKSKPMKVKCIVPSLSYTQNLIAELASKRLSEIYIDLMKIIRNKKIMSEILEIESTEDDKKLFQAFADQYSGLWLSTREDEEALIEKLRQRLIIVLEKYEAKQKNE
jgi:hypothetical protein